MLLAGVYRMGFTHTSKFLDNLRKIEKVKAQGCDFCDSHWYIEFHHINPQFKKFNVAHGMGHTWEEIEFEIGKCFMLCRKCHTEIDRSGCKMMNNEFKSGSFATCEA